MDFSVYNENISFLHIYEFVLLIIRLSGELKLQAVRRLAVSMLASETSVTSSLRSLLSAPLNLFSVWLLFWSLL